MINNSLNLLVKGRVRPQNTIFSKHLKTLTIIKYHKK